MTEENVFQIMWEKYKRFCEAAIYYFDKYPSYSSAEQNEVIKEIIQRLGIEEGVDMLLLLYQTNRSYRSLQIGKAVLDKMKQLENKYLGTQHELEDPTKVED